MRLGRREPIATSGCVLATFADGLTVPARLELDAFGEVRFSTFAVDWVDAEGNILLHFNPRAAAGIVILNSFERNASGGAWGAEVTVPYDPFPDERHVSFRPVFEVLDDRFRISIDTHHLCDFPHRAPPSAVRQVVSSTFLWRDATAG